MDSQKWAEILRGDAEELTREAYQDEGYFEADVLAEIKQVSNEHGLHKIDLIFHVDPGKQYRLIDIGFRGMTAFSEDQLAKLMPYEPGSIFNRSKIAAGLESLKKFYGSHGYINFTSVPTPEIDDSAGTLSFEIEVDEGGQFHFGDLDIEGMEQEHREVLLSAWTQLHGKAFSQVDADEFFNRYFRSPLSWVRPENYTARHIDEANRLVNYELSVAPSIP
jgi:outer membrane protein assembly factor BamA